MLTPPPSIHKVMSIIYMCTLNGCTIKPQNIFIDVSKGNSLKLSVHINVVTISESAAIRPALSFSHASLPPTHFRLTSTPRHTSTLKPPLLAYSSP